MAASVGRPGPGRAAGPQRTPSTAMRGFGITGVDFSIECQMDRVAEAVGMDPIELRILNAYRDGDMKAHRRPTKNAALIECVQAAAEMTGWPLSERFRAMSSTRDGGGDRAAIPPTPRGEARPVPSAPVPAERPAAQGAPAPPRSAMTGAGRMSSLFATRRR